MARLVMAFQDGRDFYVHHNADQPAKDYNDHCALRVETVTIPNCVQGDWDTQGATVARERFLGLMKGRGLRVVFEEDL